MQLLIVLDHGPWEVGQLSTEEEKEVVLCLNFWRDWPVNSCGSVQGALTVGVIGPSVLVCSEHLTPRS